MPVLTCFGVSRSAPRVYYIASTPVGGHVIELAWVGRWVFNDLSAITRGGNTAESPDVITCFGVNDANDSRVYIRSDGINELAWVGNWIQNNITTLAGAPKDSGFGLAVTGFAVDG